MPPMSWTSISISAMRHSRSKSATTRRIASWSAAMGTEAKPKIPGGIWALGIVSMCMDASSELIHSLLPLFMVSALGASASVVGAVEGIAEATALITKIFSGTLSDYLGKRKLLTLLGY